MRDVLPPCHFYRHEADQSPLSSAEIKECVELYLHSPNTPSWRDAHLKYRDKFTLHLPLPKRLTTYVCYILCEIVLCYKLQIL
jgi:hypothetical protein